MRFRKANQILTTKLSKKMIHKGNLEITSQNSQNYKNLVEVTGDLYIYSNAELSALKSVGGDLYIYSNADLSALKSVGGHLSINSNAELSAPLLESVGGDLYINSNAELSAPLLESVGGDLYIYSNAELSALKSVGGDLYIYSNAELSAPLLESVGGDLSINSNAELSALKSVGGYLSINSNAELSAPFLESVGGDLSINSNAIEKFPNNVKIKCLREICGNIGRLKFELIDGIACAVLSTRSRDGLIIKRCRKSIFKNAALTGDVFFVASDKKNNAHGKTAKQALEELAFKGMDRNVDKYRNMPLNTKKTPNEWGSIYRIITGACQFGVELFKSEKKLKKSYTLEEILKETQGTFGYKRFKEIIRN